MITDADVKKLSKVFATKDDLKNGLVQTKNAIVREVTDYLHEHIILGLEKHERRLDRLEKTVGGFRPLTD